MTESGCQCVKTKAAVRGWLNGKIEWLWDFLLTLELLGREVETQV